MKRPTVSQSPCPRGAAVERAVALASEGPGSLALEEALQVKVAEYWLKLGQPAQAFAHLRCLPEKVQKHPAVIKALVAATAALRERTQLSLRCFTSTRPTRPRRRALPARQWR